MDTSNLTWRDKVQIADLTARIAVGMFLAVVAACEMLAAASR